MNKAELIESIQKALGADATKRAAEQALDAVLDSIAKGVKKDKKSRSSDLVLSKSKSVQHVSVAIRRPEKLSKSPLPSRLVSKHPPFSKEASNVLAACR